MRLSFYYEKMGNISNSLKKLMQYLDSSNVSRKIIVKFLNTYIYYIYIKSLNVFL